jgi:hypothetical protein
MSTTENADEYFPAPQLYRQRYKVVDRTFDRWVAEGSFPPPDWTHKGRRYWRRSTVEQHERNTIARKTSEHAAT